MNQAIDDQRKLRVLVREVHYGGGVTARQLKVFCKRRGQCVAVQECAICEACEGFSLESNGRQSFLVCTHGHEYDLPSVTEELGAVKAARTAETTPIAEVMTKDVVCVTEDMEVDELTRLLLNRGISGVPVVDAEGNPVGVVTKTDLVREGHEQPNVEELDSSAAVQGQPSYGYEGEPGFHTEKVHHLTVSEIMTPAMYTLKASTSLAQAAALMAFENVHRLPIVANQGGEIVGLLSALDILRWLGEQNGYLLRHHQIGSTGLVC